MSRRGRHEGSIHLRGDGRWCAVLELGAGHGKSRRRKYFYAATRREVQQKLKRAERDMEAGLIMSGPDQPVRGFLRSWLEESVKQSVRPRTHEAYDLNVRRAVPHIGALKMSKLTPTALQNCYSELLSSGLSNRSVEQCHAVLHKAFRQATLWGLIARNPADAVTAPRPVRSEMQTLTADQVEQFFDQTEGDYLHALWVLFVATGMRLGEATGLRWTDIDLGKGRVSIKRTLQRQRGLGLVMAEPKNARARRTVHVDEDTLACLRAHRVQQAEHRLQAGPGWKDHDLAFSTPPRTANAALPGKQAVSQSACSSRPAQAPDTRSKTYGRHSAARGRNPPKTSARSPRPQHHRPDVGRLQPRITSTACRGRNPDGAAYPPPNKQLGCQLGCQAGFPTTRTIAPADL